MEMLNYLIDIMNMSKIREKEDDIIFTNFFEPRNDRPIWFNNNPETMEKLNAKKTIEELLEFVDKYKLYYGINIAVHNNDINYLCFQAHGTIIEKDDRLILSSCIPLFYDDLQENIDFLKSMDKDIEPEDLDLGRVDENSETFHKLCGRMLPDDHYSIFILSHNGTYFAMLAYTDDWENDSPDIFMAMKQIYRDFIEYSGVDTYRNLCRLINKGWLLYKKNVR